MLGPALFLISILFLTTAVAVAGIGAFARASVANATNTVIRTALGHGVQTYQQFVQNQIEQDVRANLGEDLPAYRAQQSSVSDPGQMYVFTVLQHPESLAAPPPNIEQISSYVVQESFANNSAGASCTNPDTNPPLPDIAIAAQCSRWVYETRLAGAITVSVYTAQPGSPGATLLAQRTETVTFRLFADAPFVSVAGLKDSDARDPTVDDITQPSPHEGDLGGYAHAVGPLGTSDARATGDTTIHLYYQCQNPAGGACPGAPAPAGDKPTNLQWQNGNTLANP